MLFKLWYNKYINVNWAKIGVGSNYDNLQKLNLIEQSKRGGKSMKKFLFLIAIASIIFTFTFPLSANAWCTKSGTVIRVTNRADGVGSWHSIYMRDATLRSYYYWTRTTDDEMAEIANNALTSQVRVTIQGNRSYCPTSGTSRYMGTLRYIITNP